MHPTLHLLFATQLSGSHQLTTWRTFFLSFFLIFLSFFYCVFGASCKKERSTVHSFIYCSLRYVLMSCIPKEKLFKKAATMQGATLNFQKWERETVKVLQTCIQQFLEGRQILNPHPTVLRGTQIVVILLDKFSSQRAQLIFQKFHTSSIQNFICFVVHTITDILFPSHLKKFNVLVHFSIGI